MKHPQCSVAHYVMRTCSLSGGRMHIIVRRSVWGLQSTRVASVQRPSQGRYWRSGGAPVDNIPLA
jgi:hypothetical protein